MKNKETKSFDTVKFFRSIKEKIAAKMVGMSLEQQKEFLAKIRKGEITLS